MNRRQFLQTLTAAGTNALLPTFALAYQGSSAETSKITPLPIESKNIIEDVAWDFPRAGILSVGGTGGAILSDHVGNLPYLARTIAIDTNPFSLQRVIANSKILVGDGTNRPFDPYVERFFAMSARNEIADSVAGLDLVFMVNGMGGAAGTEILQVVEDVLHDQDILTLGATIIPFYSEGQRQIAHSGIEELSHRIKTVSPITNESFAQSSGNDGAAMNQYYLAFTQLYRSIMNTIAVPGIIGVDLADVRCLMQRAGHSAFGFGSASGMNGAECATRKAIAHPLLAHRQLQLASGILVAIEGNCQSLRMRTIHDVMTHIKNHMSPAAYAIFSAVENPELDDDYRISILAHGFREA